MAAGPETLLRYIRGLAIPPETGANTDAALLDRFLSTRDERAFAALVYRHGPLVVHVCRRVLGNVPDVEDAFQAVFLVLARKAATVHPREALPAWLHGVARRVALKARAARARPLRQPEPLATPPADPHPDPLGEITAREVLLIIDEELQRLADVYRLPVILCCLEGRSLDEAARRLGWTPGSVKGRLERGRARLHERLVRRGLTLPAALAAVELARGTGSAAVVAQLAAPTVRAALGFAVGQTAAGAASVQAAALAGKILKGMALAKLKVAAALLLGTCLLATGLVIERAAPAPSTAALVSPGASAPSENKEGVAAAFVNHPPAAMQNEDDAPIEVQGRVLDPEGRPFAGAELYVGYSVRRFDPAFAPDVPLRQAALPLRAVSGADGRFHFTFTKSELEANRLDEARPAVMAVAGDYGPDWAEIAGTGPGAELSLQFVEDLPVSGRILDANRQPVAGAQVSVREVISDPREGVTRFLHREINSWYPRTWRGPLPGQRGVATTDAEGRFRLTGLGRERLMTLALEGPAIPYTSIQAVTRSTDGTTTQAAARGATFDYVAPPVRPVRGVVRDKATDRPIAGVRMSVYQTQAATLTDADGRFEIPGCPKGHNYLVRAEPPADQPYFAASACVPGDDGPGPLVVNFDLVRGTLLSGRVTDCSTRKPPRAAVVEYYPLFPNPHSAALTNGITLAASSATIRPDGSYSLVVLPGPGVVCVAASPRDAYAVARVDDKELADLFHDGQTHCGSQCLNTAVGANRATVLRVDRYNTLTLIHPGERAELPALALTVQPARTLQGALVGPGGEPLTGVEVVGLTALPKEELLDGASFSVKGLNPLCSRELIFLHRQKNLGKALSVRGDEAGPLTVRLDPCGSILGRLVDRGGKPVPEVPLWFTRGGNGLEKTATTDGEGRFRAPLVPGQKYSLMHLGPRRLLRNVGAIEVESGQCLDLGDVPLAN
jgi:RNA polymerase sigma factor (sigma-70 family)